MLQNVHVHLEIPGYMMIIKKVVGQGMKPTREKIIILPHNVMVVYVVQFR